MVFALDAVLAAIADCSTAIAAVGSSILMVCYLIKAYRFIRDVV